MATLKQNRVKHAASGSNPSYSETGPAGNSSGKKSAKYVAATDRFPSPLTRKKLERLEGYKSIGYPADNRRIPGGDFSFIAVKSLQSMVHPTIANLDKKIKFVNEVAEKIKSLPHKEYITIISVGAGRLLLEELINRQLPRDLSNVIRWRCIDVAYRDQGTSREEVEIFKETRREFGEDKKDARAFSTTSAYLKKLDQQIKLSVKNDCSDAVVILSISPPTAASETKAEKTRPSFDGTIKIKGTPLSEEEVSKSNTVLIKFYPDTEKGRAEHCMLVDAMPNVLVHAPLAIKCFINKNNQYEFQCSKIPNRPESLLKQALIMHLQPEKNPVSMENLYRGATTFAKYSKDNLSGLSCQAIVYSDYDKSIEEIVGRFQKATGPVVLATFKNSEIEIRDIKTADAANKKSADAPAI